jgi:hypothetical protein
VLERIEAQRPERFLDVDAVNIRVVGFAYLGAMQLRAANKEMDEGV